MFKCFKVMGVIIFWWATHLKCHHFLYISVVKERRPHKHHNANEEREKVEEKIEKAKIKHCAGLEKEKEKKGCRGDGIEDVVKEMNEIKLVVD